LQGFHGSFDEQYDVVVVGCGAAGLAAAVSAAEVASEAASGGLAIAVLERAPREERGGNTRWTGSYMRLKNENTPAEGFVEDMLAFSKGKSDERYVRTLAEKAPETISWLKSKGVEFGYLPTIFLTMKQPRLLPVGGGAAIVDTLSGQAERMGVSILYETTAQRLILADDGSVAGLEVEASDGNVRKLGTRAVVIASGGFEGNPEMLAEHIPRSADVALPPIAPGGSYNKGEGIRMALEAGAASAGQWDLFHAENTDPRSEKAEAVVMAYPYGILVNKGGERFLDEGEETIEETFELVSYKIFFEQDGGIAYTILDQKLFEISDWERAFNTDQEPYEAETIAGLAEKAGIDPKTLEHTVAEYNAATPEDDSGFNPHELDGLATTGLLPPKSNWARPLDDPPFMAYPIAASNVFTFGGIATNERAEVLHADGGPIPGLYAAGEMTGLYYHKYPGATSVLRSSVFGKIAGSGAARHALQGSPVVGKRD